MTKSLRKVPGNEIIDYALRYLSASEIKNFPDEGDLFLLYERSLAEERYPDDDEGWEFRGYHQCLGYVIDDKELPVGKWVWMYFVCLKTVPPLQGVVKLQPPHIARGTYYNAKRTREMKVVKIEFTMNSTTLKFEMSTDKPRTDKPGHEQSHPPDDIAKKIIAFPSPKE